MFRYMVKVMMRCLFCYFCNVKKGNVNETKSSQIHQIWICLSHRRTGHWASTNSVTSGQSPINLHLDGHKTSSVAYTHFANGGGELTSAWEVLVHSLRLWWLICGEPFSVLLAIVSSALFSVKPSCLSLSCAFSPPTDWDIFKMRWCFVIPRA